VTTALRDGATTDGGDAAAWLTVRIMQESDGRFMFGTLERPCDKQEAMR
jgi:hypothetical protein